MAFRKRSLKTGWGKGVVGCMLSSWTFFWLVGGEVIGSQHHQPSGSQMLWGLCACGQQKLTSSTWWGFQYLQNSSKDMAQNISCSPWGGTKGPWLCLMATIVILSCLTVFLSLCIFSLLWLNLFFGTQGRPKRLKFSYRREAGGGHARESGGGGWGGRFTLEQWVSTLTTWGALKKKEKLRASPYSQEILISLFWGGLGISIFQTPPEILMPFLVEARDPVDSNMGTGPAGPMDSNSF